MWIEENRYLSRPEMENNVVELVNFLAPRGWTVNALAGMCGNMQYESTINPGIWQSLKPNPEMGFGLVQWTPATKLITWAESEKLDYTKGTTQCLRFDYEIDNNLQWIKTTRYPITFEQFKRSLDPPYTLGGAFLYNYERPKTPDPVKRGKAAEDWYEYITGIPPKPPTSHGMPFIYYLKPF